MIIHGGACAHKRVEWQWAVFREEAADFGNAVCYDCRLVLMYTNVPCFVHYIVENKWVYMPRLHGPWINQLTSVPSRPEASSH